MKARRTTEPSMASAHVQTDQRISDPWKPNGLQDISETSVPQNFCVGSLPVVKDGIYGYPQLQRLASTEQAISATGQTQLLHNPEPHQELISDSSMSFPNRGSCQQIHHDGEDENDSEMEDELEEASEMSDTIDYSLVRRWLQYCEQHHGDECSHRELEPDYSVEMDIILIDVRRNCLARATTAFRYLAVSYVWGAVPQLLNSSALCESLMAPDALSTHEDSIPQVIIDAINVVKSLQENYLWVDSLCIVQDDAAVKHHQIAHMAIIYSSSILTLVAVGARDANSNLPGVRPLTRWPREKQRPDEFNRPLRPDLVVKAINRTVYVSRAWTFQERHLSRRCLYFLDEQVYFQCRMELWCEEKSLVRLPKFVPAASTEKGLNIMSRAPAWRESINRKDWDRGFAFYAEIIQEYSWKALSFPEDVMNAFSGLLNALETHSSWNLTHGLPEQLMDWALVWIPAGPHQRRPPPNSGPLLQFPSWSWIGWIGPVTFNLSYDHALVPLSSHLENVELETFEENTTSFIEVRRNIREKSHLNDSYRMEFVETKSVNLTSWREASLLPGNILRFTAMTISAALFQTRDMPPWRWNAERYTDKKAMLEQTGVSITSSTGLAGLFPGISLDFLHHYKWSHLRMVAISTVDMIDRTSMPTIMASGAWRDQRKIEPPVPISSSDISFWESYISRMSPCSSTRAHDFLHNVMLVQKRGPYYERVAVGQMVLQSWNDAKPIKETILLV